MESGSSQLLLPPPSQLPQPCTTFLPTAHIPLPYPPKSCYISSTHSFSLPQLGGPLRPLPTASPGQCFLPPVYFSSVGDFDVYLVPGSLPFAALCEQRCVLELPEGKTGIFWGGMVEVVLAIWLFRPLGNLFCLLISPSPHFPTTVNSPAFLTRHPGI